MFGSREFLVLTYMMYSDQFFSVSCSSFVAVFFPTLFKDQCTCRQEIKKIVWSVGVDVVFVDPN